jgi:hypothetical protein
MGEGEESQSSDMSSLNIEYQLSKIVTTQPATPPKNSSSIMRTSQIKSIRLEPYVTLDAAIPINVQQPGV